MTYTFRTTSSPEEQWAAVWKWHSEDDAAVASADVLHALANLLSDYEAERARAERMENAANLALIAIEAHEQPRTETNEFEQRVTIYPAQDLGMPGLKDILRAALNPGKREDG